MEDSPSDQRLVREQLVQAGVAPDAIVCAGSLADARRVLTSESVDCLLLDLSLPDAIGLEGVSVMAAAAPDTPIIVVTHRTVDSLVYAAMAEGADEYLCKSDLHADRLRDLLLRAGQRRRGSERARTTRTAAWLAFDSLEAQTATLDGSGRIVAVNQAWSRAAAAAGAGVAATGVGVNYLTICDRAAGPFAEGAAEAAAGIRAVLQGDTSRFAMDYWCPAPDADRWFSLRVTPLGELGGGAVITHLDITDLKLAEQRLQRDEARLHTVFDESSPIFALIGADGVIQHVSDSTTRVLGLSPDQAVGTGAFERVDPEDVAAANSAFERVRTNPGAKERLHLRAVDEDGRWREFDLTVVNLLDDPVVRAVAVTGCDVTEGRLYQIARRLESRLLRRLPAAVIVTDDRGVVVYWNDMAAKIYGYAANEAVGRSVAELSVGPAGVENATAIMASVIDNGRWEGDYEARRCDGSVVPTHTVLERVDDDEIAFHGIVGASIDISERRRLEEDLAFQALHDPLTGLPNRRLFVDHLDGAVSRTARTGSRAAVLFIDLDDFKSVNDRAGNAGGDEILRAAGELISAVVRTGDTVARLGGDEFVVCCDDIDDPAEAYAVTDRILEALSVPFRAGSERVVLSASIGLAVSAPRMAAGVLLRNAHAAMYAAKRSGKGRVEVFDDVLHERAQQRHELGADLKRALAAGEIEAHFQPQIAIGSGALEGFEALARWRHASGDMVAPDTFIPVAEEVGLVGQLGAKVLFDACCALSAWLAANPERRLQVSVNVSARQLSDGSFIDIVAQTLAETRIPPGLLCLEVTESALVDADAAATALRRLKSLGVKIAIDDFGTGYSSLSRLHSFPFDYLKIDRSFVAAMVHQAEDTAIVAAVLGVARALGVRTVAEGIEDPGQLAQLRAMGCNSGQGFLWSAAVPADEALLLASSPDVYADLRPHPAWPLPEPVEPAPHAETSASTDAATAIALLAHELAGPITVLTGRAELLAMSDSPEIRTGSVTIIGHAARATRTVLDLVRDVAALDAGTLALEHSQVRFTEVIAAALNLSDAMTAVGEAIDRPIEIDVPDVLVDGDADRLVLVFVNLLSNATKHAPPGSTVRVRGETDGRTLTVHVIDNGPGVPVEHVGVIFRRFGRASEHKNGSGLGLYLARGLVRAHGGELSYQRGPDGGADFAVELPLIASAVATSPQPSDHPKT